MVKYFKTLFIVLFAAVLFAGNLQAADDITSKNSIDFNKINKKLEQIDDNLKKENLTEDNINTYVSYLSEQEAQISATRKDLDKDIKYIQKQLDALEKYGIYPNEIDNAGKAAMLLERLNKRRMDGLSTPKQIRLLENKGFLHVGEWTFQQASNMITRIAANGWRVPVSVIPAKYVPEVN